MRKAMTGSSSKRPTRAEKRPEPGAGLAERIAAKAGRKEFFEPLDEQERDIRAAIERGELVPAHDEEAEKEKLIRAARTTLAKNRHISIRLSEKDLTRLRARASELGIPYQTLIGSILHQYAEGKVKASF
jgi:predicted DNA binding CopG/RHH family protein